MFFTGKKFFRNRLGFQRLYKACKRVMIFVDRTSYLISDVNYRQSFILRKILIIVNSIYLLSYGYYRKFPFVSTAMLIIGKSLYLTSYHVW